jgi:hypothetical protein
MRVRLSLAWVFLSASLAFGEAGTGTIRGTVRDSSGSPLKGAAVEVRNAHTKVVYSAVSDGAGSYALAQLPVGQYAVTLRMPRMKTYSHAFVAIEGGAVVQEDVALEADDGQGSALADDAKLANTFKRAPGRDFLDQDAELALIKPVLSLNGDGVDLSKQPPVRGQIVWFYLRGHGRYLLSLAPNKELGFSRAGVVDGSTIELQSASQDIQIGSAERIVEGSATYNLYLLRQADWLPADSDQSSALLGAFSSVELSAAQ